MSIYGVNGTELDSAYSVGGLSLSNAYDVNGNQISLDGGDEPIERDWLDTAVATALTSISQSGTKQGGCTDGTYIYQCAGDSKNYTYMNVIKYKISDGTYTVAQFSGTPNFGHANDMTYNPNTGYLYVGTMLSDGTNASIIVLDPTDLSYVETVNLGEFGANSVWQFCYDRLHECFYVVRGDTLVYQYDDNWKFIKTFQISEHPDATGQGCETDGRYFYRITYNPNLVNVYDLETAEFVKNITIPVTGEPEAIMYDWNGHYYFSRNTTTSFFYSIQLFTLDYSGKSLSILGDSISTYAGYIPSGNANYYTGSNCGVSSVNQTWWKRLIDAEGMTLNLNNSWSGSRVTTINGTESAGVTRASNLGTNPDVIIVFMGINDFISEVTVESFRTTYGQMIDNIKTAYPNAKICCATLPPCDRNAVTGDPTITDEVNDAGVYLSEWNQIIKDVAISKVVYILDFANCGITYATLSTYMGDYDSSTGSALHPNSAGHELIAQKASVDLH